MCTKPPYDECDCQKFVINQNIMKQATLPPIDTPEQIKAYIQRMCDMTPEEREAHKLEIGLSDRDVYGSDVLVELCHILLTELKYKLLSEEDRLFMDTYRDDPKQPHTEEETTRYSKLMMHVHGYVI